MCSDEVTADATAPIPPLSATPREDEPGQALAGVGFVIRLAWSAVSNAWPERLFRQYADGAAPTRRHFYELIQEVGGAERRELRLGPFESARECDAILAIVRARFSDASRVPLTPDDARAIATAASSPPSSESSAQAAPSEEPLLSRPIDSTATVRELSAEEIASATGEAVFSIELMCSPDPIEPSSVAAMDLLTLYRLYAVSAETEGLVLHSLRLGFFSGALAAAAVADYLRSNFEDAVVIQVSREERQRFAEQRFQAGKDVGDTGLYEVIELATPQCG
jgi:hypothetical protein